MSVGSAASSQLEGQTSRLRNTNSTLKKIEETVPGAEKLISLISKHEKKNTVILAFVISVCLVITLYSLGVIAFIKKLVSVVPSVPSSSNTEQPIEQHISDSEFTAQKLVIMEPEEESKLEHQIHEFLAENKHSLGGIDNPWK